MEEDMAAAMLMRLQPKQSSAILNEMDASRAVMLTKKVAALSSLVGGGKKQ
jgi:flagellar motility protein MotE (MotC chaperone)